MFAHFSKFQQQLVVFNQCHSNILVIFFPIKLTKLFYYPPVLGLYTEISDLGLFVQTSHYMGSVCTKKTSVRYFSVKTEQGRLIRSYSNIQFVTFNQQLYWRNELHLTQHSSHYVYASKHKKITVTLIYQISTISILQTFLERKQVGGNSLFFKQKHFFILSTYIYDVSYILSINGTALVLSCRVF